ncbi:MAG: hypothetical protein Q4E41_05890 [Bacteroidales bacterium]|nr:hypothetical protein [Bacteroidales bacterium]
MAEENNNVQSLFAQNNQHVANGVAKRDGETYAAWGSRYAGATNASLAALKPALNQVISTNIIEQTGDEAAQNQRKVEIQAEIEALKNNISDQKNKKTKSEDNKKSFEETIKTKEEQIVKIKDGNQKRDLAKVMFYIFAVITLGLGIYLYLFYGSAAYSAFFGSVENIQSVNEALFNPRAYSLAWANGKLTLFLILLFPTIFVALGMMLHMFMQEDKGVKYFKIVMLFFVAFVFDAILAYKISEMFFIPSMEVPRYSMSLAFQSTDFWFVIFCGFVSYIIWGLIFGKTMEHYQEMTEGSMTIKRLKNDIAQFEANIAVEDNLINQYDSEIINYQNQITQKEAELRRSAWYDVNIIKQCLNSFFQGWIGYMTLVGKSQDDMMEAQAVLNERIQSLNVKP